jgi:IQ calmodulin-binding motif
MIDYDLPLMEYDMKEMRAKSMIIADKQGNEFVKYKEILDMMKPKNSLKSDINHINKLVTKVQAVWRGYQTRKNLLKYQENELKRVGKSFSRVSTKGVMFKDDDDRQGATKKPGQMTAEERKVENEKKKKQMLQANKLKKKKSETLDAKMNQVVKPPKEKGVNDKQQRMREELANFIKNVLLEEIITAA